MTRLASPSPAGPLVALLMLALSAALLAPLRVFSQAPAPPFPISAAQYAEDTWADAPLYRMVSALNAADVMYTTDTSEYGALTGSGGGFTGSGPIGFVCPTYLMNYVDSAGTAWNTAPVYELLNPDGSHVYTMDPADVTFIGQGNSYVDDLEGLYFQEAGADQYLADEVNPLLNIAPFQASHPYLIHDGPVFYAHVAAPPLVIGPPTAPAAP